ncbi:glycosyltransferase family 2 protein [Aestuariibaculum suncheonense]|uniref:Glycosyltransferase family 2 protein n=1 Tax=Aestuariibaculum suncheonense TaxID=1028745 RepID=A0A8J6QBI4_9FLAO|nr:glycosyltransferase family 2 protein [Aestuariibaculum suncheonense]MBD0837022.1 glycosyltransferase family 2 protein [Aestuariibaculum suncheonense]
MLEKKVFLIIVAHNGMTWIDRCLKSCGNYPVIVVDNASTDETVLFIEKQFPEVILLKQSHNLGFGAANNIGMKYALEQGADYVFLLNQDAYLEEDTLVKLVEAHKRQPDYGVLSPMHLNGTGDKLDYNFSLYITPNRCKGFYSDFCLRTVKNTVYETGFVNAAAWLLSRECIEKVGGFNPSFYHYGEDDNYAQRIKYHGLKIGVLANTFIRHDRGNKQGNVYFQNKQLVYERQLVMKYSNPFHEFTFSKEYKKQLFSAFKGLLSFNINTVKKAIEMLKILNDLNKTSIIANRAISKKSQLSFL